MTCIHIRPDRAITIMLGLGLALCLGLITNAAQAAPSNGNRFVLLGTAGGPSIKPARSQPANALVINGDVYIIDAGDGVSRQMGLAGISAKDLKAVFITHNHSDHVADYGTLLLRAWASGLKHDVDTYGPPPIEKMTKAYLDGYMGWDIRLRTGDEDHPLLNDLVHAHNITENGQIYQDKNLTVTALEVPHGAAKPTYALKLETAPGCTIVYSSDTSGSQALRDMAHGADMFVHEVLSVDGIKAIVNKIDPGNEAFIRHITEAHTPAVELGKYAAEADVGMLVLTHFVPAGLSRYDNPDNWTRRIRQNYDGDLVIGQDLQSIPLCPE